MRKLAAGLLTTLLMVLYGSGLHAHTKHLPVVSIWVFPHDDLAGISSAELKRDYLDNWVSEMKKIVDYPIQINFERNIPGLTDISYVDRPSGDTLSEWADASWEWRKAHPARGNLGDSKYLLLTRNVLGTAGIREVLGIARQGGHAAVVSTAAYSAAGHELGHTFNATHEQSRVLFNGWFCETYMVADGLDLRSNCYSYSDANRRSIASYLDEWMAD